MLPAMWYESCCTVAPLKLGLVHHRSRLWSWNPYVTHRFLLKFRSYSFTIQSLVIEISPICIPATTATTPDPALEPDRPLPATPCPPGALSPPRTERGPTHPKIFATIPARDSADHRPARCSVEPGGPLDTPRISRRGAGRHRRHPK